MADLRDHPLFTGKQTVGMISGENPKFPVQLELPEGADPHEALGDALKQAGLKYEERSGRYGTPERSYMVYGPSREALYQLGKQFGQESVVFSKGGKHELLYTNGPNAGRFNPSVGHEFFTEAPTDYYTHMPEHGGYLRLNFDDTVYHPTNLEQPGAIEALNDRAAHEGLTKSQVASRAADMLRSALVKALTVGMPTAHPHPHAYDWHEVHTDHNLRAQAPGVVVRHGVPPHLQKANPPHELNQVLSDQLQEQGFKPDEIPGRGDWVRLKQPQGGLPARTGIEASVPSYINTLEDIDPDSADRVRAAWAASRASPETPYEPGVSSDAKYYRFRRDNPRLEAEYWSKVGGAPSNEPVGIGEPNREHWKQRSPILRATLGLKKADSTGFQRPASGVGATALKTPPIDPVEQRRKRLVASKPSVVPDGPPVQTYDYSDFHNEHSHQHGPITIKEIPSAGPDRQGRRLMGLVIRVGPHEMSDNVVMSDGSPSGHYEESPALPFAVRQAMRAAAQAHMRTYGFDLGPDFVNAKPLMQSEASFVKAENDQVAAPGTSSEYVKYALPYGKVDKSTPSNLKFYPYEGKNADIDGLIKNHGFNVYYAGGKHGRPNLAERNYNTKHLMVYDPSAGSGGDFGIESYTDGWRKIHELAHALTYPELNKLYGEGRRMGKLGTHRTPREAMRAVHWEWLAAHKQRELGEQLGVHIPDEHFNKELNTVMHDAVHRAVTGKFSEPSDEGFHPHSYRVPLEHSLGLVREAAHNLQLTGPHDLIRKGESTMADEKIYDNQEWRQALAKSLRERVDAFSKQMLELRQRELQKSLPQEPAPLLKAQDMCPMCKQEDRPGMCKCLTGMKKAEGNDEKTYTVHDYSEADAKAGKDPLGNARKVKARNVKHLASKLGHPESHYYSNEGEGEHYFHSKGKSHVAYEAKMKKAEPLMKPPVSEAQRRAMGAAASGNSTLGIPKKVGREFIDADKGGKLPAKKAEKSPGEKEHDKTPAHAFKPDEGHGRFGGAPGSGVKCRTCGLPRSQGNHDAPKKDLDKAIPLDVGQAPASWGKGEKEFSSDTKAKEPVKADPKGGNGIKVKALEKAKLPGMGATPTGLTHPGDTSRAASLAHFTNMAGPGHSPKPAAPAAPAPGAARPKGLAAISAVSKQPITPTSSGAPKLPGMGAPKPAAPAPGVGGLKSPPKLAAPKPAAGAAPAMPKAPGAPTMKSELTKSELGNCPLCNKAEHLGECK